MNTSDFEDEIRDRPGDALPRLVYADYVQEHGDDEFAEILRGPVGAEAVWYWHRGLRPSLRECAVFAAATGSMRTVIGNLAESLRETGRAFVESLRKAAVAADERAEAERVRADERRERFTLNPVARFAWQHSRPASDEPRTLTRRRCPQSHRRA